MHKLLILDTMEVLITCKAYEIDRPTRPGWMPPLPELCSITANNAANKMIKLPMDSNRIASHLNN